MSLMACPSLLSELFIRAFIRIYPNFFLSHLPESSRLGKSLITGPDPASESSTQSSIRVSHPSHLTYPCFQTRSPTAETSNSDLRLGHAARTRDWDTELGHAIRTAGPHKRLEQATRTSDSNKRLEQATRTSARGAPPPTSPRWRAAAALRRPGLRRRRSLRCRAGSGCPGLPRAGPIRMDGADERVMRSGRRNSPGRSATRTDSDWLRCMRNPAKRLGEPCTKFCLSLYPSLYQSQPSASSVQKMSQARPSESSMNRPP